jgi:hypothetical protein
MSAFGTKRTSGGRVVTAFRQGLNEVGFVEGQRSELSIVGRWDRTIALQHLHAISLAVTHHGGTQKQRL